MKENAIDFITRGLRHVPIVEKGKGKALRMRSHPCGKASLPCGCYGLIVTTRKPFVRHHCRVCGKTYAQEKGEWVRLQEGWKP